MGSQPGPGDEGAQESLQAAPLALRLSDFEPLRPAERILLRAYRHGDIARVSLRRPSARLPELTIRAGFLSLVAQGMVQGRLHDGTARRLQLLGAWVEGRLDLSELSVPMSLWFFRCVFDAPLLMDGTTIAGSVSLRDCAMPSLHAEGCVVAGDFVLNAGSEVQGEVILRRATIEGDLDCVRARLACADAARGVSRRSLVADGARINGDVRLKEGFETAGELRMVGASIGGDLDCTRARLSGNVDVSGSRRDALCLERLQVQGHVLFLGLSAAGAVRLPRARIEGDLDCTGAAFDVAGDAAWGDRESLVLERVVIQGALCLRQLEGPLIGASLAGANVGELVDDTSSWGERITLEGFVYRRFAGTSPVDAESRLSWLASQPVGHLDQDFRAEPWRQVIKVLRRMGHADAARDVAVGRERHLRGIGRVGEATPGSLRWLPRWGHALYGTVAGYGYRPGRLVACMTGLWLLAGGAYWAAAHEGVMAPTDPMVFNDPRHVACRAPAGGNWTRCASLPVEVRAFSPWAYSLDVMLPLVDLQQHHEWAPTRRAGSASFSDRLGARAVQWLVWLQSLLGVLGCLTLAASLTGLTDRDRRR